MPSAGLPIASDLAIVDGRTGCTTSCPALYAADTGEQPVACAPNTLYVDPSTNPSCDSSRHALSTLVSSAPDATGTTTRSGKRQPSCSAMWEPTVLDPSAWKRRTLSLTNAHSSCSPASSAHRRLTSS